MSEITRLQDNENTSIHPNAMEDDTFTERYCTVNGIQMYYECENTEKAENTNVPAIIFIHGWTANRLRLHPLYILYAQEDRPVFRLDLRGHGWSQKTGIADFSIDMMTRDVEAFIQDIVLKKFKFSKVILLGHSMGGAICQNIAIKNPEYLEKLVLCNTFAQLFPSFLKNKFLFAYIWRFKLQYQKLYNGKKAGHERWGLEHFPMWFDKYNSKGRDLHTAPTATIQGLWEVKRFDSRKQLHKIQVPTLIATGDEDVDVGPKFAKILYQGIPHSEIHIIRGVNHDLIIGKPFTFKKIMDSFLRKETSKEALEKVIPKKKVTKKEEPKKEEPKKEEPKKKVSKKQKIKPNLQQRKKNP